ncbi:MAG: hypothetical protein ACOCV2_15795 [Persicimonas sp.]
MHADDIPLEEPCCESWNEMNGDNRRRHCEVCATDVINLSALTEAEARKVLSRDSLPCIRFTYDEAGQVVFMHPQVRRQRRGARRLLAAAALVAPLLVGAASTAPTTAQDDRTSREIKTADDLLTDGERKMLELASPDEPRKDALGEPQSRSESEPVPDGPVQAINFIDESERVETYEASGNFDMGQPGGFEGYWN